MGALDQESMSLRNSAGTVITLSGPIYVVGHQGLGMVKPNRARQRGPYQHGYTLTNATLGERVVTLKLAVDGVDDSAVVAQTRTLVQLLNNLYEPLYLDVTAADGLVKRLDVYYQDGLSLPHEAEGLYGDLPDVIQLVADNPIAYESTLTSLTLGLGGGDSPGYEVPAWVPFFLGAADIDTHVPVVYAGTWAAYPIIRIVGPITDCIISNATTGETLDFTGTTIAAAHWYEIDCRYGYKTVTDNHAANQLGDLTAASDLATFHIAPADEAAGGNNDFHVTGDACTGATIIYMSYHTQYLSAL